jgi:hypothetical protein
MQKLLYIALILSLITCAAVVARPGQSAVGAAATNSNAAKDELLTLLPASDLIATIDAGRTYNDLVPRLASIGAGGLDRLAKRIQEFAIKTGIDPSKVEHAVLGLKLNGTLATGAIIIQGIDVDDKKIEAAMKAYNAGYKPTDYKGKQIFTVTAKIKPPSAGPLSIKTDETAVATLGQQRVVLGDLSVVKSIIDIQSGSAKGGINPAMSSALKETRNSALVRFAFNLPEDLRQEASNQGDLFRSIAAIKMILGTLDVDGDLGVSLDAIMKTPSQNDAAELETGLRGLISLGRGFLGGGSSEMNLIGQILDQIRIAAKLSDVNLSINLPRSIIDQMGKKPATEEKKQ